jgi:iron(III) transport system substrate-binding protein
MGKTALLGCVACLQASMALAADPALVEAAKKEATISFYSAMSIPETEAICQGFEKAYALKCEFFRAPGVRLFQKFEAEAEAGQWNADVIHASTPAAFLHAKQRGFFEKYTSQEASNFPVRFKDPDGYYVAAHFLTMAIAYNPKLVKEQDIPHTWKALLDPRYKGLLVSHDPGTSGTGLATFYWWEKTFGLDFIKDLAKNEPMVVSSSANVEQAVLSGERPIAVQLDDRVVTYESRKGEAIAAVYPKEGVPLVVSPVAIAAKAPHPHAAQLFVDFMLSVSGQEILQNALGADSPRPGMPPTPGAMPVDKLTLADVDWTGLQVEQNEAVKRYTKLLKGDGQ